MEKLKFSFYFQGAITEPEQDLSPWLVSTGSKWTNSEKSRNCKRKMISVRKGKEGY